MSRTNTRLIVLVFIFFGFHLQATAQYSTYANNLQELPIELSWDDYGIMIRTRGAESGIINMLNIIPSQHLEKLSNDFVRVKSGAPKTPVIIDLSAYYQSINQSGNFNLLESPDPKVRIEMPRLAIGGSNDPNSFILELLNYTKAGKFSKQTIILNGLDVLHIVADECARMASEARTISIDVNKCDIKFVLLKGGLLSLNDMKTKIPELCRKYNSRYYIEEDAFVCLEDCKGEDPNSAENLKHIRGLITKYNITDFEDEPISFIDNIILTKKGIGINLRSNETSRSIAKPVAYSAYNNYRFFPWFEFINLSFARYSDSKQIMVSDPYNNSYIFSSRTAFSNVELIQFLNELKALISTNIY